jgi:hypothetical protein
MGLLRMAARTAAVVGTAGAVQHHQQTKYAAQDAAAQPQYVEAPAAPAAPAEEDPLLQIQKLGALKDQGLLTEEEFSAKKAQILGL